MNFSGPSPHLFGVLLDVPGTVRPYLHQLLSMEERKRSAAFHFERDRKRWTTSRASLRLLLAEKTNTLAPDIAFSTTSSGKPFLVHPVEPLVDFNLSHTADHALIAISDEGPIGVDLERFDRGWALETCLASFCSREEVLQWETNQNAAERRRLLVKIWCAKEAFLKALGLGLTLPPETLTIEWISPDCAHARSGESIHPQFHIHFPSGLEDGEFCAAVALPVGLPCPQIQRFDAAARLLNP